GLLEYLRVSLTYLLSFSLSYLAIALFFALQYWAIWKIFPRRGDEVVFAGINDKTPFLDCLYFSVVTIATLGYGDIAPKWWAVKLLANVEVVIGVGWITIMFALVMADLQPVFGEIAS